ncbi:hypothetical protein [Atopomonas sediminilitoris]|uniref:hypothetical protein n=1 Tax=Atopomonas sediminilitoris TaxID=2919919 RepID=UPI002342C51C|nr:hypothetical protein [Atopomonas sediminilitoris]
MSKLTCFKAYDICGRLGNELNEEVAYRIGRACAHFLDAKKVVVGGVMRLSSEALKQALANGLMDAGCGVIDLGVTGAEEELNVKTKNNPSIQAQYTGVF